MFKPWTGDRYGKNLDLLHGKRVLVVGESHHDEHHEPGAVVPDMTIETMNAYRVAGYERWMRTLDNQAWAIAGKLDVGSTEASQRKGFEIWRSLAFYNYIPVVLARWSREGAPTAEQFRSGKEPFENVLDLLKPDLLLVWGYRLFPWVVHNHYPDYVGRAWEFSGEWIDVPREKAVRVVRLRHPSTGFSWRKWHDVILRALAD